MTATNPEAPVTEGEIRALDIDLDRVWHGIEGALWAPPASRFELAVATLLRSPALARALCTTPSLVLSWVLASVAVFAIGALATGWMDLPLVPLVAPAVAAVAVAFSYGAGADPAYEIARTMPVPARMILLVRVVVVFATNALLGIVASVLAPTLAGITGLWLLPMLAISMLALAVAVVTHSAVAGGLAALVTWIGILGVIEFRNDNVMVAVTASTVESWAPFYLAMLVASGAVVWWMSGDGARRREMAGWWQ